MDKFLHMADFFSTGTGCGACDKYQVCRQLDDQHRNPNMNNKDHHVGQLTNLDVHLDVHLDVDFDIHLDEVIDVHLGLHFDAHFDAHLDVHFDAYLLL